MWFPIDNDRAINHSITIEKNRFIELHLKKTEIAAKERKDDRKRTARRDLNRFGIPCQSMMRGDQSSLPIVKTRQIPQASGVAAPASKLGSRESGSGLRLEDRSG
jgi:hypothetical protein